MSKPPSKGRGAASNRGSRFNATQSEREADGWSDAEWLEPGPKTSLTVDSARTILSRNQSPDIPFDRSINPYRGCEHGCVYCYARPTHAWLGLSPGLDFETQLFFKADAAALLEAEFARPGYRCAPVALGVNTDAYQPIERRCQITRELLQVLLRWRHPVQLITKSGNVERDLDLLGALAEQRLVQVAISITTLDSQLARRLEPRAASTQRRLRTIERLTAAGVPAGVFVAPVIPALTDDSLESILDAARAAGAVFADWTLLRLPLEVRDLFAEWLQQHYPDRAGRVMGLIRDARGGQDNDARFGHRMRGQGAVADLLEQRFGLAWRRLGYALPPQLRTDLFAAPQAPTQMSLF